jgi:predicted metalloprotease with PDZ domain
LETVIRFWHGQGKAPFTSYLFMLNAVNDGYGGLEHRNSTALICGQPIWVVVPLCIKTVTKTLSITVSQ